MEDKTKAGELFDKLTSEYGTSAREYFGIIKLALMHTKGIHAGSSWETVQALEQARSEGYAEEVMRCAVDVLQAINNRERGGQWTK